ncbi:MAG: F0F1 ATP synthase subunit delta [Dehalococcoidia bacterium]
MAEVAAARRYAQAAFDIANDSGTIATWRSELDDVASVLAESGLAPVLADGKLTVESRLKMVERALNVSPMVMNLAKLLVQKGRSLDARWVANAFARMADEHEGIAHAQITTAIELSPEQLDGITKQLSTSLGKEVRATSSVDPSIVGGVVIKVGDKLVDGSVKTRLRRLRRELEGVR